jgi:hypothetical protein
VQHKKRGRPRLRDEREQRYEGLGQAFTPQPEHLLRRPMSMYPASHSPLHHPDALNRSGPYRVLKSQSGTPMVPRYLEHASPADANIFAGQAPPNPRVGGPQDVPLAYLNMDLQISNASRSFSELLGIPSLGGRKLLDIVASTDRDKVYRLQRVFEDERQEREPNYLPPIYGKTEEDRVIQSIPLNLDEGVPFRTERQELLTFQEASGQQRSYQVRLGLAKRESTYYVVLILVIPAPPATSQEMYQMSSSPYHPREASYGFRTSQQSFVPPPPMSSYSQYPTQYAEPRGHDPQMTFRQPPPLPSNSSCAPGPAPSIPSYAQPFPRAEYGQVQNPRQIPRSEISQAQPAHQSEFRLPPLQRPPGAPSAPPRGDDRGGRVDIGGLLEDPKAQRKPS